MKTSNSLFQGEQVNAALKQSFVKLDPRILIKNPVMFTVEIGTFVMLIVSIYSFANKGQGSFGYNVTVFFILLLTVLFANFAELLPKHVARHKPKACAKPAKKLRHV